MTLTAVIKYIVKYYLKVSQRGKSLECRGLNIFCNIILSINKITQSLNMCEQRGLRVLM